MKIYDFREESDIKDLALNLLKQLSHKKGKVKNSDILESLSKIHGYKDWNSFKVFVIKKNNSFSFNVKKLQELRYQYSYNLLNMTDIKNFSHNFRYHLNNQKNISEIEILNSISLSIGYKNWLILNKKFKRIEEKTNIINQIINQDINLKNSVNAKYIKEPFLFFKDIIDNLEDKDSVWWDKALFLINILLSALIELKGVNKKKIDLNVFKEYLIIDNLIELSESDFISIESKHNLSNYLHSIPGYYAKTVLSDYTLDCHGYIQVCIHRIIREYTDI